MAERLPIAVNAGVIAAWVVVQGMSRFHDFVNCREPRFQPLMFARALDIGAGLAN